MRFFHPLRSYLVCALLAQLVAGCGVATNQSVGVCTDSSVQPTSGLGAMGSGRVFYPDPVIASGQASLQPDSDSLDSYAVTVDLQNLTGRGILEGKYVDVRDGLSCDQAYGAFSATQAFEYKQSESPFQEVSAYHAGDRFLSVLDQKGYWATSGTTRVVVHCIQEDNAYYARTTEADGSNRGEVCLGDSVMTPGASYADDAMVIAHELQHGSTGDTYSAIDDFNQFHFDEAGALNEALSDFMSLGHFAPLVPDALDPRFFSRWALGKFSGYSYLRGAHRCPEYDASFPECGSFALGAAGFSTLNRRVSYAYPDGLGWPYAKNYDGSGVLKTVFLSFVSQEQIHNVSTLAAGALWDVLQALKPLNNGDLTLAYTEMVALTHEAIKLLPKPTPLQIWSPVSFRGYATALVSAASLLGLSDSKKTAIQSALTARGLLGGAALGANWAQVGPGATVEGVIPSAGLHVVDDPDILKSWLEGTQLSTALITQTAATVNHRLDLGEVAAIWLDIRNLDSVTAGGVNLKLTSLTPDVSFLRYPYNRGGMSTSQAQIQYSKINGTDIVAALTAGPSAIVIPTGSTYFKTNPHYYRTKNTAVWVRVASALSGSGTYAIRAEVSPSNGPAVTLEFPLDLE